MGIDAWLAVGVVVSVVAVLAATRLPPDLVLVGGAVVLTLLGVMSPEQALVGLTNQGMVTVALLFVIAAGVRETGLMTELVPRVLGRPRSTTAAQIRLMAPVTLLSAILNNTPVVAIFIPAISEWARANRIAVSKLMIPLSYAAIIGGTCTLIGTSTNLIVNGLYADHTGGIGLGLSRACSRSPASGCRSRSRRCCSWWCSVGGSCRRVACPSRRPSKTRASTPSRWW